MTVSSSAIISADDYNQIAYLVNQVWADARLLDQPGTTGTAEPAAQYAATYSAAPLILNKDAANVIFELHENLNAGYAAGQTFTLDPAPTSGDFIVVVQGIPGTNLEAKLTGYTIDYGAGEITFTNAIAASTRIVVYNRETHHFGWGNSGSVYPVATGAEVTTGLMNGLIDKTNAMLQHIGDPTALTRITAGNTIYAADSNLIENTINNDIIAGDLHLTVDSGEASLGPYTSIARSTTWNDYLIGEFRYTFTDYDEARFFFNSGGDLRFYIDVVSGGDAGGDFWDSIAERMGVVIINYNNTTQALGGAVVAGVSSSKGFYHLTEDYQLYFQSRGPGSSYGHYGGYSDYNNTGVDIYAKYTTSGSNHYVDIKLVLDDTVTSDTVDGTITCYAGYKNSNTITDNSATLSITAPSVTDTNDFNTGDDV